MAGADAAGRSYLRPQVVAVAVVAMGIRLLALARSQGGPNGLVGYDASVYYAGAESLTFGHLPYRDFVFLHPPGILLFLIPFSTIGRFTSDTAGFDITEVLFAVIGATNAVLVILTGRRLGFTRPAALTGGVAYALWYPAVATESAARLEPLGNMFLLLALFVLARKPLRTIGTTRAFAVGALAGLACTVKIWWAVPLVALAVWIFIRYRPLYAVLAYGLGAATSGLIVAGPFFFLCPRQMWQMVVQDQLGRHRAADTLGRLYAVSELRQVLAPGSTARPIALALVFAAFALLIVAAVRNGGTLPVVLTLTQLVVLLLAPVYVDAYAAFLAGPLALSVCAAVPSGSQRLIRPVAFLVVAASFAATAYALVPPHRPPLALKFPGREFGEATRGARCVMSDSPMALIQMNVLTRDFRDGCVNWIDVTGRQYEKSVAPTASYVPARANLRWQQVILPYLISGNAAVIVTERVSLNEASLKRFTAGCKLAKADGFTLYRTMRGKSIPKLSESECRRTLNS